MARSSDLAKLIVRLEAQTADYEKKLNDANRKLSRFEKGTSDAVRRAGRAFVGLGIAAAAGLAVMVRSSIKAADETTKLAQQVGTSTEALSQLTFAADLSGVSQEQLGNALKRVSRSSLDAVRGLQTAVRSYEALDINVRKADGSLKASDELLSEVADRFARMEDGVAKTALAQELFGKSGAKLIPLLNLGSVGINKLREEADRLGITLDEKTGKAAEEFNDNLTRLSFAARGIALQLAKTLLPKLNELVEKFKDPEFQQRVAQITADLVTFTGAILTAAAGVARFTSAFAELVRLGAGANPLGSLLSLGPGARQLREAEEAARRAHEAANTPLKRAEFDVAVPDFDPTIATDETDRAKKKLEQLIAALKEQEVQLGLNERQIKLLDLAQAGADQATQGWAASVLDSVEALEQQNQKLAEAAQVVESTRTPLENMQAQIVRLNELRNTFVNGKPLIDAETYERAVTQVQDQFDALASKTETTADIMRGAMEEAGRAMQDALADFLFDPFKDGLKGMVSGFATALQRIAAQAAAAQIFNSIAGGFTGGGDGGLLAGIGSALGGAFGGGKAAGGPVTSGRGYLVGERGPEFFVPHVSGHIEPAASGAGGRITQVFNISTPDANSFRASQRQIQRESRRRLSL